MSLADGVKRVLVGRPFRSDRLSETLLPKRLALPVFASDALSSVAYAPNEIFLTLAVAGVSAYAFSWQIGLVVAAVMAVVLLSYRQNVHAYPSGGGDYEVATVNLGQRAGLTVASALLVDYVLTVAVSISSAAQYAASLVPGIRGHEAVVAVVAVVVLTAMNLRGVRESGFWFAIPTYVFMVAILGMAAVGTFRALTGSLPTADSAQFTTDVQPAFDGGLATLAGAFLLLRAFSSGCAALTGVEAISNGVPAFRKPKSANAAATLAMLGALAITMIMSILLLARQMRVVYVDEVHPERELQLGGQLGEAVGNGTVRFPDGTEYHQSPIIRQLADGILDFAPPLVWLVTVATGIILVLAANTAFNGFPVLGSILARDGFLPRQLHTRGDRLAFSNGIIGLAAAAIVLILAFDAEVSRLIQLYIVGVFVSFTLSQTGMIRHWTRHLRLETVPRARLRMQRSRVINSVGLAMTATVLVVVLITKFLLGAWIAIVAMVALFLLMRAIRTHYDHVTAELDLSQIDPARAKALPSRVHAIVLVSKLHLPTMRALAYARAARASTLEAITVDVDHEATEALRKRWEELDLPVPLKALHSPYREITRPILRYVKRIRRVSPRDLVVVYVPEYVVGHWWEQVLHNQSALRLKSALHFTPGVVVASVPWQLQSSIGAEERMGDMLADDAPGDVRKGLAETPAAPPAPPTRAVTEPAGLEIGEEVLVEIGSVAHGGHCVARYEGRVLFVRHALPGEQVRARITSGSAAQRFWRADVVEVLESSPHRVEPPCPWSGPGRCGGCDWQHAAVPAQRDLKAAVVREQLDRLGGVEVEVDVEAVPVPGRGDDGLAWRTRVQYAVDTSARAGLHAHRSHTVVRIDRCRIAADGVQDLDVPARRWPGAEAVQAVASGSGERAVVVVPLGRRDPKVTGLPDGTSVVLARPGEKKPVRVRGRTWLTEPVELPAGRESFRVGATGFWQVHPQAAATLAGAVHALAEARTGDTALDLYSGVGLFTAVLAEAVGPDGVVLSVESDGQAVRDARRNLHRHPQVRIEHGRTQTVLGHLRTSGQVQKVDVVVLDPPRSGAGRAVVDQVAGFAPRVVVYVACDPSALGRDTGLLAERGYRLDRVRAFDLFPMTHHVECVARFVPAA